MNLTVRNLGTDVGYEEGLALQQELLHQRIAGEIPDCLLYTSPSPRDRG